MQEQMGNVNRELDTISQKLNGKLEIKNRVTKMKNAFNELNS